MGRTTRFFTTMVSSLLLLTACSSSSHDDTDERTMVLQQDEEQRMFVHHYKVGCQGVAYQTCLLTRETRQDSWTYFYDAIEHFEFEWGYLYELRVRVTEIENPPADASSRHYSLIEQVQKIKVDADSSFTFSVMPSAGFTQRVSATQFLLGYEIGFSCNEATCNTVASLLTQEMAMLLNFQHANDASGQLRLQQVVCSDTPAQFHQSCLYQN